MIVAKTKNVKKYPKSDILILMLIWAAIILIKAFDKDSYHIHFYEFIITLNKLSMLVFVNYFIFPKYYLSSRLWQFILALLFSIFLFGYVEEFFIEPYLDFDPYSHPIAAPTTIFISYAIPLSIYLGVKFLFYFNKREQIIDKLEKEKSESQLSFLKSQINPHILFNNLNNIYSLSLQKDTRANDAILKLSHLMRYVIYDSSEKYVLLSKELDNLDSYLELQKIQLEGRGKIVYNMTAETHGYTIAPLLLLPFVENCFKHSMNAILKDIVITIEIKIVNDVLHFYCSNPFTKTDNNDIVESGIGLKNTKQRLDLMYPNNYELIINENNKLFEVDLKLNLL